MLVSMDVTSLYTNIPQEEGINIVCKTYETFHLNKPPIPSLYLRDMLRLILGQVQTPYFTWAESNANEGEQRIFLICIRFG